MPSAHLIRSSSEADAVEIIDVDAEDEDERAGAIPFGDIRDFRPVSPAPPDAVKSEPPRDGGGVSAIPFRGGGGDGASDRGSVVDDRKPSIPRSAAAAAATAPAAAPPSGVQREENVDACGNGKHTVLSLCDEKYAKIIKTIFWPMRWGERTGEDPHSSEAKDRWQKIFLEMKEKNSGEDPHPKDLAPKIFDELVSDMWSTGGSFYRYKRRDGTPYDRATNKEAVKKIYNDLARGKTDYTASRFRASGKGPRPRKNNKEANSNVSSPQKGSNRTEPATPNPVASKACGFKDDDTLAEVPAINTNHGAPTKRNPGKDLTLSLLYPEYQRIVMKYVKRFLHRSSACSLMNVAEKEIKAVQYAGGKVFRKVNQWSIEEFSDDKEAHEKMKTDIEKELSEARKKNDKIIIVHLKNEKYKNAITEGAQLLAHSNDQSPVSSRAGEIARTLMQRFKDLGVEHFFKSPHDDEGIECNEALDKISKDIREQARGLYKRNNVASLTARDDISEDFLSSTRKKRKNRGNSTIQCETREFMAHYVSTILPEHGWTVKRKVKNKMSGLDDWIASRTISGNEEKYVGYDAILDEAYLSGFYEEHVVGTEVGKGYLENAGILDEPFSIFSDELKREREDRKKRHKLSEKQTNSLLGESQRSKQQENSNEPGDKSNLTAQKSRDGSKLPDRDAEKGPRALPAEGNSNNNNGLALCAMKASVEQGVDSMVTGNSTPSQTASAGGEKQIDPLQSESQGSKRQKNSNRSSDKSNLPRERSRDGSDSLNRDAEKGPGSLSGEHNLNQNNGLALRAMGASVEQEVEAMATGNSTPSQAASVGSAMGSKAPVFELYQHIRSKASGKGGSADQVETLQKTFYKHLKKWLAHRMKDVVEADLTTAKKFIDEFESAIAELEKAANDMDEDDIIFYKNYSEDTIERCKAKFPV